MNKKLYGIAFTAVLALVSTLIYQLIFVGSTERNALWHAFRSGYDAAVAVSIYAFLIEPNI